MLRFPPKINTTDAKNLRRSFSVTNQTLEISSRRMECSASAFPQCSEKTIFPIFISCGIFFGRHASRRFVCTSQQQCAMLRDKASLTNEGREMARKACRACRLQKCLLVGMKPEMSRQTSAAIGAGLEVPNATVPENSKTVSLPMADKFFLINRKLATLTAFERQMVQFHAQDRVFAPGFLEQFDSLKKLLQFGPNILANFHTVTAPLPPLHSDWLKYAVPGNVSRIQGIYVMKMHLICAVELLRAMPLFGQLDPEDAVSLTNFVAFPLYFYNGGHYAARLNNSRIMRRQTGFSEFEILMYNFGKDPIVKSSLERIYRKSMDKFNRTQMTTEEFLLLRSIITLHSATTGLSNSGRDLVQTEAEKHATILMQYLRCCHGDLGAAKRYAELLLLAEEVFHDAHRHLDFATYFAATNEGARRALNFPPALGPMLWHDCNPSPKNGR